MRLLNEWRWAGVGWYERAGLQEKSWQREHHYWRDCDCVHVCAECLTFSPIPSTFYYYYLNQFLFLAVPRGIWALSSSTRGWTWYPLHWKLRILTTGLPGKSPKYFFKEEIRKKLCIVRIWILRLITISSFREKEESKERNSIDMSIT